MNSLEWVNEQIEYFKMVIKNLEYDIEVMHYSEHLNFEKEQLEHYEQQLTIFEQIKNELEAWEVVKEELQIVDKTKNPYGEPLYRYELNVVGQDKINTLKKALEAKDE